MNIYLNYVEYGEKIASTLAGFQFLGDLDFMCSEDQEVIDLFDVIIIRLLLGVPVSQRYHVIDSKFIIESTGKVHKLGNYYYDEENGLYDIINNLH